MSATTPYNFFSNILEGKTSLVESSGAYLYNFFFQLEVAFKRDAFIKCTP